MSAPVCQFVDRVGSGAVQRLNLNDGKNLSLLLGPGQPNPDFSPPPLKRAVVNTLLAEGAFIPASAYDNRIIRLPLRVTACDEEEMAEVLESLHRELDRGNNILKWQPTYNSRPVYFRTFRSPDFRQDQTFEGRGELRATLAILAEPFAYGDYVEQTGTINNDPEAVANGLFFEIAVVEGDIPTPLFLHLDNTGSAEDFILAVRRHGTPALYFEQCESMVQGVDTLIQANDPLMSGAGQNWSQTTFAAPAWNIRLSWHPCPAAGSSVEYRGTYRVFGRFRANGTGDKYARFRVYASGAGVMLGDIAEIPTQVDIQLVDLGLLHLPPAPDPIYDGYRNVPLPVQHLTLELLAMRDGGAGTLDWDYVVLVPADEELSLTYFNAVSAGSIFDGPNNIARVGDLTDIESEYAWTTFVGSIPLVSPDQTNLYVVARHLDSNVLADVTPYTARYWPRHLYTR